MELTRMDTGTSYPVECGRTYAQYDLTQVFKARLDKARVAIVTDREVSGHYINEFVQQFDRIGKKPQIIVIDGSQAAKSLDAVRLAYERLTDMEFSDKDMLFALGGGGVIDVAAFVAATYRCGIEYVQVPTSLLAMIDSSISATAYLNFQSHKNQIGARNSPKHVVIDTDYLKTLPARYKANGIAQVILYGLLADTDLLVRLAAKDTDYQGLINACFHAHAKITSESADFLSFGHEIAEAIEGHFRFLKYTHGEAMALGMLALFRSDALLNLYEQYGLPTTVSGVTRETLLNRILKTHENNTDRISTVRLHEEGKPYIDVFPASEASDYYAKLLVEICGG